MFTARSQTRTAWCFELLQPWRDVVDAPHLALFVSLTSRSRIALRSIRATRVAAFVSVRRVVRNVFEPTGCFVAN